MTIDEAKNKMDFLKKAYQKLIDEKVDSGKLVGDGVRGEWKAETPLDEAYKDIIEALDLAIKALEHYELSGRQIERSYEMEYTDGYNQGWKDGRKALEQQPCEDAISREELLARIDEERKHLLDIKMDGAEHILVHHARRIIEDMPSVIPQPKTGHWIVIREEFEFMCGIVNEPRGCKCSNCNKVVRFKSDFCPNCGADMRGNSE